MRKNCCWSHRQLFDVLALTFATAFCQKIPVLDVRLIAIQEVWSTGRVFLINEYILSSFLGWCFLDMILEKVCKEQEELFLWKTRARTKMLTLLTVARLYFNMETLSFFSSISENELEKVSKKRSEENSLNGRFPHVYSFRFQGMTLRRISWTSKINEDTTKIWIQTGFADFGYSDGTLSDCWKMDPDVSDFLYVLLTLDSLLFFPSFFLCCYFKFGFRITDFDVVLALYGCWIFSVLCLGPGYFSVYFHFWFHILFFFLKCALRMLLQIFKSVLLRGCLFVWVLTFFLENEL